MSRHYFNLESVLCSLWEKKINAQYLSVNQDYSILKFRKLRLVCRYKLLIWIMFTVGTVDVMSTEYRSIFRWRTSAEYRSYVGGISVNCRWYVGQLSVICRSTVGGISVNYRSHISRMSYVSANYWPIHRSSIGRLSAKCRPSVGQVSARYRWPESYIGRHTYRPTIDWLSTDYRLTIDRLSTECRSTVDRVSIDSRSSVDRQSIECRPLRRPI